MAQQRCGLLAIAALAARAAAKDFLAPAVGEVQAEYDCGAQDGTWPDVDSRPGFSGVCSPCMVLVNDFGHKYGSSCSQYCSSIGRGCRGGWEEVDDSCTKERELGCDAVADFTSSDALCECLPYRAPAHEEPGSTAAPAETTARPRGVFFAGLLVLQAEGGRRYCVGADMAEHYAFDGKPAQLAALDADGRCPLAVNAWVWQRGAGSTSLTLESMGVCLAREVTGGPMLLRHCDGSLGQDFTLPETDFGRIEVSAPRGPGSCLYARTEAGDLTTLVGMEGLPGETCTDFEVQGTFYTGR